MTDTLREAVEREAKQMRVNRDYLRGHIKDRGNARAIRTQDRAADQPRRSCCHQGGEHR